MDEYLHMVRSQLKLCEQALLARIEYDQDRPKGIVLRRNRLRHSQAMLALVQELRVIAAHERNDWWDDPEDLPF